MQGKGVGRGAWFMTDYCTSNDALQNKITTLEANKNLMRREKLGLDPLKSCSTRLKCSESVTAKCLYLIYKWLLVSLCGTVVINSVGTLNAIADRISASYQIDKLLGKNSTMALNNRFGMQLVDLYENYSVNIIVIIFSA